MRNILLLLTFLTTCTIFGQDGKKLPSLKIPRIDTPEPDKNKGQEDNAPQFSLNKPFEPKLFKVPPKKYDPPQADKQLDLTGGGGSDLDVGKQYAAKMNKSMNPQVKEGVLDPKEFRRHQYFGDFKTESETISLSYRDFGEVDADRIRVWVDGKVIADLIQLEGNSNKIFIGLVEGINHIEIEAINEGALSPNTGDFKFFEENGNLITGDQWGLATGFKAKFNIERVPKGTLKK